MLPKLPKTRTIPCTNQYPTVNSQLPVPLPNPTSPGASARNPTSPESSATRKQIRPRPEDKPAPESSATRQENKPETQPGNKSESHRATHKNKLRTAPNHPHNPKPICWGHRKPKKRKNPYRNAGGRPVRSHRVRASLSDPPDNPKEPIPTDTADVQSEPGRRRRRKPATNNNAVSLAITSRSHHHQSKPNDGTGQATSDRESGGHPDWTHIGSSRRTSSQDAPHHLVEVAVGDVVDHGHHVVGNGEIGGGEVVVALGSRWERDAD